MNIGGRLFAAVDTKVIAREFVSQHGCSTKQQTSVLLWTSVKNKMRLDNKQLLGLCIQKSLLEASVLTKEGLVPFC